MKRLSMTFIALLAIGMLYLVAGCGNTAGTQSGGITEPTSPTTGAAEEPTGTTWVLTSYGPSDQPRMAHTDAPATALFGGGTVRGSTGCNEYSADYTVAAQSFTVGQLVQTERACVDNSIMEQEAAFTAALQSAQTIAIDGDTLTISYDGGILRFARQPPPPDRPLVGTVWQLTTFVSGDVANSLLNDTQITLEFADGQVRGTAGCNQYTGAYTLSDSAIKVGDVVSTKMACSDEIMKQEFSFVEALQDAKTLSIEGNQLRITHGNGTLLFTAQ